MLLANIRILKFILKRSEAEDLTVEEVIYFVFEFFERVDVLLFHVLAILESREMRYLDIYN